MYPAWAGQASERRGGLVYIRDGGQNKQDLSTVGFVACCIVKMIQLEMQWTHGDCVFLALRKMAQDVLQKKKSPLPGQPRDTLRPPVFWEPQACENSHRQQAVFVSLFSWGLLYPNSEKNDPRLGYNIKPPQMIQEFLRFHCHIRELWLFQGTFKQPGKGEGEFTSNSWDVSSYIMVWMVHCGLYMASRR